MTEEQKEILLGRMVDNPAGLSSDDMAMIAGDEELRELYQLSADLKTACVKPPEIDEAKEWQRFRSRMRVAGRHRRWSRMVRVAAIFLGVMLLSGVAVTLIDRQMLMPESTEIAAVPVDTVAVAPKQKEAAGPGLIAEAAVKDAVKDVVTDAGGEAKCAGGKQSTPSEPSIEEYLAVQQARIENEIATELAEAIKQQYLAEQEWNNLQTIVEPDGLETVTLQQPGDIPAIRNVILQ